MKEERQIACKSYWYIMHNNLLLGVTILLPYYKYFFNHLFVGNSQKAAFVEVLFKIYYEDFYKSKIVKADHNLLLLDWNEFMS